MSDPVFTVAQPSIAIAGGTARYPIRRVFCVGRNYAAHAREMGSDPEREAPFFFMKPADAVVAAEGRLPYPPLTGDLHHEIELVVAVGGDGVNLTPDEARKLVWGYGVGVDLTRRDLQAEAKANGRPWDWAKGFDASGPCSALVPVAQTGYLTAGRIWLKVNGELRQQGDLADMIYDVAEVLAHISRSVALRAGDLVFTGTPSGVAPLAPGDQLTAGVDGVAQISFHVGPKPHA
jgi:fumarylpyruvate hydrolase